MSNLYSEAFQTARYARFDFSGAYVAGPVVKDAVLYIAQQQAGFAELAINDKWTYLAGFEAGWAEGPLDAGLCAVCGGASDLHFTTCRLLHPCNNRRCENTCGIAYCYCSANCADDCRVY